MSPPRQDDHLPSWASELADVRERLARLEAITDNHDKASADRHDQLLTAIRVFESRLDDVERRAWKVALALAALGMGGGAGAIELLRSALGG